MRGSGGSRGTSSNVARADPSHTNVYQPTNTMLGHIANLTDPNADRILFWDDSAGILRGLHWVPISQLRVTTLDATGGGSTDAGK